MALLTIAELAARAGLAPGTLQRRLRRANVEPVPGRRWRRLFRVDELPPELLGPPASWGGAARELTPATETEMAGVIERERARARALEAHRERRRRQEPWFETIAARHGVDTAAATRQAP